MKHALPLLFLLPLCGCVFIIRHDFGSDVEHRRERREAGRAWTTLVDGTSLGAWRGYRSDAVPAGWRLEDGALTCAGGGGDLITKEQWGSFELVFDWKIEPGGNSGVMFHVTEEHDATYETGPEYQVLDNALLADGGDARTAAAANYALHAPPADHTNPAGEWNQARLVCDDGHVTHWLNGHLVVEYELWTAEWRALVKASKFDAMPDYGTRRRGHVALQDHGSRVAFRNVRIRGL